jgi:hypothetical protein
MIRNKKPILLFERNCHVHEKSEAIASCKEMPVTPVNKVVDKKNSWKMGAEEEKERHSGSLTKQILREPLPRARRCRPSRLTRWWTRKE